MAGRITDRKGKGTKSTYDHVGNFTLPDSLPCSETEFLILTKKPSRANWLDIVEEGNQTQRELRAFAESKRAPVPKSPFLKTETDYIKNEVFVHLLPALEETLQKAQQWQAFANQKCFFNGIDHIVQCLWNNNPQHPDRLLLNLHVFNMPWVRNHLRNNPRPYYPKSWLWPEDYAATLIQKTVRQYFVQRDEQVQEMRDFWKRLEIEQNVPEMEVNPLLLKKFASQSHF